MHSADYAIARCPSVRPSHAGIPSKRLNILKLFSPSGSHTILVFSYQAVWQNSDGNPHGGIGCKGVWKSRDLWPILALFRKWYKIYELYLQWPSNGKSYMVYRTASFYLTVKLRECCVNGKHWTMSSWDGMCVHTNMLHRLGYNSAPTVDRPRSVTGADTARIYYVSGDIEY